MRLPRLFRLSKLRAFFHKPFFRRRVWATAFTGKPRFRRSKPPAQPAAASAGAAHHPWEAEGITQEMYYGRIRQDALRAVGFSSRHQTSPPPLPPGLPAYPLSELDKYRQQQEALRATSGTRGKGTLGSVPSQGGAEIPPGNTTTVEPRDRPTTPGPLRRLEGLSSIPEDPREVALAKYFEERRRREEERLLEEELRRKKGPGGK